MATSASYVVGAVVGHVCLSRRLGSLGFRSVADTVGAGHGRLRRRRGRRVRGRPRPALERSASGRVGAVSTLMLGAVVGVAVLALVMWRLRISELQDIVALARRR